MHMSPVLNGSSEILHFEPSDIIEMHDNGGFTKVHRHSVLYSVT